jgi:hypothetical protein
MYLINALVRSRKADNLKLAVRAFSLYNHKNEPYSTSETLNSIKHHIASISYCMLSSDG